MFALKLLLLLLTSAFLLVKCGRTVMSKKLTCPYPLKSSILPCTCQMQAELEDKGWKEGEVIDRWGQVDYVGFFQAAFLGTFRKSLVCNLDDTFSFTVISEAFKDSNKIHDVKITGKHNRSFFVTGEDLGRLNISVLVIEVDYTNNQKIIEAEALKSSEGSLSSLKLKNTYGPSVVGKLIVDVRLDFLKPVCPTLEELELKGVPVSILTSEDFAGCSQLTSLTLHDSKVSILGTDVFKHLINIKKIQFSSGSKFWVQSGAFKNLENLTGVDFDHGTSYRYFETWQNQTIISDGAFNSLPRLNSLRFYTHVDLFDGVPFLGLSSLRSFTMFYGKQSRLQNLFDVAPKLGEFYFQEGLEYLEDNAFEGLPSLYEIVLSWNRLTTLNKAFHGLPKVHSIDLSGNKLTSLDGSFYELPNIRKIDVSNNNLVSINGVFENLQGCQINVEGNTNLSAFTIFKHVITSETTIDIKMSDIPLECGCNMKWLAEDPEKLKSLGNNWRCENGEALVNEVGKTLQDLVEQNENMDLRYDPIAEDLANKTILELVCPAVEEE